MHRERAVERWLGFCVGACIISVCLVRRMCHTRNSSRHTTCLRSQFSHENIDSWDSFSVGLAVQEKWDKILEIQSLLLDPKRGSVKIWIHNLFSILHFRISFRVVRARTAFAPFDSSSTSEVRRTGTHARMLQSLPPLYSSYRGKDVLFIKATDTGNAKNADSAVLPSPSSIYKQWHQHQRNRP